MMTLIKSRWYLLLVLIVFIVLKIPHLHYPYYWDESWPYAVAVKDMYVRGISLLPSAMDPEISRGHPLFFHVIAAMWMHVFGYTHVSMHSFALLISVLFLISIYEAGYRLFNAHVAMIAITFISTVMVFFVQSSFLLLEMLVAFLCFLSLVFYVKDKYFLTALCLSCLFYTKESGLIMGFVLGLDALVSLFNKNNDIKTRVLRMVSVTVPVILIAMYFLLQKQVRGWYMFPFYNNLIEHEWPRIFYNFRRNGLRNTFQDMMKYYYFLLVFISSVAALIKTRNIRYLAPLLPGAVLFMLVDDRRGGEVDFSYLFIALLIGTTIYMFYLFRKIGLYENKVQEKVMILSASFIFFFLWFSSFNFFTYRYLLAAIIPVFFFVSVLIEFFVRRSYQVLFYPFILVILCISVAYAVQDEDHGDANLGAFDGMDVQQKEVDFMLTNYRDKTIRIGAGSFLIYQHLIDTSSGFIIHDKPFTNVKWEIDGNTSVALFDNVDPDYRYEEVKNNPAFKTIYRYQKGKLWAEIFGHK